LVGVWGERSFWVKVEVDALSRFAGHGDDLVPVPWTECRNVGVESPLHATFGIGAKIIWMRHGVVEWNVGWEEKRLRVEKSVN
jgi:hypothetical protein